MKVKFYSPVAVSCCSLPRTWDIGEFPSPKAPANRLEMFPSQSNPPQEPIEAVASQTSFFCIFHQGNKHVIRLAVSMCFQ